MDNNRSRIWPMFFLLVATGLFGPAAYADEKKPAGDNKQVIDTSLNSPSSEVLDVNLNSIYLQARTQKGYGLLSELVLQLPYPISETAKKTGQGPFGGITYLDDKTLALTDTQQVSVYGLGRIYYSTTVPGETPLTFIPYLTWFRSLNLEYNGPLFPYAEKRTDTWLTPGFMYSYRITKKLIGHVDMDAYSYSKPQNNRGRIGFSYLPRWPVILSASYERVGWDLDSTVSGNDYFMQGNSGEYSVKIIVRDPPQGNFALILGYGTMHNAAVPGFGISDIDKKGSYVGVEASAGVLAW